MWARRVAPKGPSAEQATCLSGLLVSLVRSQAEPHLYRHSPLEVGPQCPAPKPRKIVISPEATNPNASNSELPSAESNSELPLVPLVAMGCRYKNIQNCGLGGPSGLFCVASDPPMLVPHSYAQNKQKQDR